jgi:error-prone DNA polymerase
MPAYAELQVMSNFSFLHGASHAHELVAQAKGLGLAAIAIADRNTLAGVVRAHTSAKAEGLRLVVGARLDLEDAPSLICLPRDRRAYGRLSRLLSLGQGRAEKGGCILRLEDVAAHAQDQVFIALPPERWNWREEVERERGCHASRRVDELPPEDGRAVPVAAPHPDPLPIARGVRETVRREGNGEREKSSSPMTDDHAPDLTSMLIRLRVALGPAPLYLAASHGYRGEDRARIVALARIGERAGTPIVATGDVLYHTPHRRPLQDVLTCVAAGVTIGQAGARLQANAERHLRSPAEMARLFKGHEAAIARTLAIVEACRFSLDELVYEYPEEPTPPGKTPQGHLEDLSRAGACRRFPDGVPAKVAETLERELALIAQLSYAPYFLTVYDIVAFAHERGILAQGRGSAANSVVCYCLGVTSVDPTEVDLLFERFISAERREPPDIDVDFEHERREEVIQYIYARYGRDRAGIASTVISYRARSAVRDVGKVMGLSEDTVAALAGTVWGTSSNGALPERHIRDVGLDPTDPLLRIVLELADELMGFPRHLSQHVGGFVLTRGPLVEVVPVGNAAMADRTFIEWDKDDLAALGLMKVDVLALGMLTCIRKAFDLIDAHHGQRFTLATVPRDDPAVYDMLCRADSIGVFQVESRAQMNMLPRLRPRIFYDLVIEVAIVRPGPIQGDMVHPYLRRRSGLEAETYPAPDPAHGEPDELHRILAKTKGVPLFQEQAMRIAMEAARFSDAEVNELRKAMATFRRRGTIGELEEKMVSRMVTRGYAPEFAQRCFNQIKGFGEYGFPESHAASFALLVYVSAWIKCHHPAAFACALLNSQPMGFYAPAQIVRDAREHGVEVREVDVNFSQWDSTLEDAGTKRKGEPALRLGLRQIDGLAEAQGKRIAEVRATHGDDRFYATPDDLVRHADVGPPTLEKLAAADAFGSLGLGRRNALWAVEGIEGTTPLPLFDHAGVSVAGPEPAVALSAMPASEEVVADYETLRLSLKAHPVSFLRARFAARKVLSCVELQNLRNGAWTAVAGVVLIRQRPGSAKGVVFMTIEDETGIANVVVWAKTLERFRRVVMGARLVLIRGRIQRHENIVHLVSASLEDMSGLLATLADADTMPIPLARADEVRRPESGSARKPDAMRLVPPAKPSHPRLARIMPKSRDFH